MGEWMEDLTGVVRNWLINSVPKTDTLKKLPTGRALEKLVLDPCFRCFQREYNIFREILISVHGDLTFMLSVLTDQVESNNRARALFQFLRKELIPTHWLKYGGVQLQKRTKANLWLPDLKKRVLMFAMLGDTEPSNYITQDIWLGGFIAPAAMIAATKQAIAYYHSWEIQDLTLKVTVDDESKRVDCFTFVGMRMFGAKWENGSITIDNDDLSSPMPALRFTWIRKKEALKDKNIYAHVPIYLDESREELIWSVHLVRPKNVPPEVWDKRGVCLTVWELNVE